MSKKKTSPKTKKSIKRSKPVSRVWWGNLDKPLRAILVLSVVLVLIASYFFLAYAPLDQFPSSYQKMVSQLQSKIRLAESEHSSRQVIKGIGEIDTWQSVDAPVTSLPNDTGNWTLEKYPNYYRVIGKSDMDETQFPLTETVYRDFDDNASTPKTASTIGKIDYTGLDELGRTLTVRATLTYVNVFDSYGTRQTFAKDADPAGWGHNDKVTISWVNGRAYHGYFWNRSHLVADSLGGAAIRQNLITGTRPQNVGGVDQNGGMRYTEKKAQKWLEANQNGILYYEAKTIYYDKELVPRSVMVSMKSSDGAIDEQVEVFNVANGFTIDYSTGIYSKNN